MDLINRRLLWLSIPILAVLAFVALSAISARAAPTCQVIEVNGTQFNVCIEAITQPTPEPTPGITATPTRTPTATVVAPTATPAPPAVVCPNGLTSRGALVSMAESGKTYKCLRITNPSGPCVFIKAGTNIVLDNIEVTNCGGNEAIAIDSSTNITVQNSYVHDLPKRGIYSWNSKGTKVLNNRIERLVEGSAINIWSSTRRDGDFLVKGNTVKDVGCNCSDGAIENGVSVYRTNLGMIEGNDIRNAQMGGVRVNGGSKITIRQNTLIQDRRVTNLLRAAAAVYIESCCDTTTGASTDNLIELNTLVDSDGGIEITNFDWGTTRHTVRNNVISGNRFVGVYFEGDGLIQGNEIRGNPEAGIYLHFRGNLSVISNTFSGNGTPLKTDPGTTVNGDWQSTNSFQ